MNEEGLNLLIKELIEMEYKASDMGEKALERMIYHAIREAERQLHRVRSKDLGGSPPIAPA